MITTLTIVWLDRRDCFVNLTYFPTGNDLRQWIIDSIVFGRRSGMVRDGHWLRVRIVDGISCIKTLWAHLGCLNQAVLNSHSFSLLLIPSLACFMDHGDICSVTLHKV
jgi:hypothetical protein